MHVQENMQKFSEGLEWHFGVGGKGGWSGLVGYAPYGFFLRKLGFSLLLKRYAYDSPQRSLPFAAPAILHNSEILKNWVIYFVMKILQEITWFR